MVNPGEKHQRFSTIVSLFVLRNPLPPSLFRCCGRQAFVSPLRTWPLFSLSRSFLILFTSLSVQLFVSRETALFSVSKRLSGKRESRLSGNEFDHTISHSLLQKTLFFRFEDSQKEFQAFLLLVFSVASNVVFKKQNGSLIP